MTSGGVRARLAQFGRRQPRLHSPLHGFMASELHWERHIHIPEGAPKVAVFAQYSPSAVQSRSVAEFARQLIERDYRVLLVANAMEDAPLRWPGEVPDIGILRKPNLGYDFGSWAIGLAECPEIMTAERVLFVNDSLAGPFWSIDPIIDHFESSQADAWGLMRSEEVHPHLQSFIFGMRGATLRSRPVREFWESVHVEPDHFTIVMKYELGLSAVLYRHSMSVQSMFASKAITELGENATTFGWLELLRAGVPFVKRQLLRDPDSGWRGDLVPKVLKEEFGVELGEWL